MNTLLHICCTPCSIKCIEQLEKENIAITGFWSNSTIHPFTEYKNRKNAVIEYSKSINLSLVIDDNYGLRHFIDNIYPNFNDRCSFCYTTRLEKTAKYASENGFDSFTTTLLISPYQNHDLICDISRRYAEKYSVEFLYRDFRTLFREGQSKARELGIYMQKYCGCIFSEEERYKK